jgi:hypothetical protein
MKISGRAENFAAVVVVVAIVTSGGSHGDGGWLAVVDPSVAR